jgi:hypothetical protein
MRKLITLLLLFISILGYSQQDSINWDKYKPIIAWKTIINNVQYLGQDTFSVVVAPIDDDPGTFPLVYGNYIEDKRGLRYEVIDTTNAPTLIVVDFLDANYAPFQGEVGTVYLSANNGESPSLPTGNFEQLDPDALQYGYGVDMSLQWGHGIEYDLPFKRLVLDTTYVEIGDEPKGTMYWDEPNRTYSIDLGNGVVLQVGQETQIPVHNNTGLTIINGRVLFGQAVFNDRITVGLATNTERYTALLIATEDILNNTDGLAVELVGRVNDVNTGGLSLGPIYVDVDGLLTNTKPEFPEYTYPIGAVVKVGVTDGIIQFRSDGVNFYNSIRDAFDGSIRETFDFRTFVEGGVVKGVLLSTDSHDSLTTVFSNGWFDFTVPDTIDLTAGTLNDLTDNYIYIDKATRTLQTATSFPFIEHSKISFTSLLDPTTTDTYGAMINQNFNDHFKYTDDNGHILHLAARLRTLDAKWESGTAATLTGTTANVYIQITAGKVWHLHLQDMPVINMSTGDVIWVVNDPDGTYRPTSNLNDITEFSDGSNWNNEWGNIVVWGAVNKTGEISQLLVNLPSDGYQQEESAIADALNYTNYTMPRNFRGKGFLIGRFTIRRSGASTTYNPSTGFLDLRGFVPNTTVGGGTGGSTPVTEWTQLNDIPASYLNFAGAFATINALETGVEFILREDMPLTDLDSTGFTLEIPQVVGLVDSLSDKWNNDGTSTAAGDWDIGAFDFTAATLNATNLTTGYMPYDNGTSLVNSTTQIIGTTMVTNLFSGGYREINTDGGSFTIGGSAHTSIKNSLGGSGYWSFTPRDNGRLGVTYGALSSGNVNLNADIISLFQNGNIAVGKSALEDWGSNFTTLEVGGQVGIMATKASDSDGSLNITQNSYFDGGNWIYINTGTATTHRQFGGAHTFRVAQSGTAGNVISWTDALNIEVSGNATFSGSVTADEAVLGTELVTLDQLEATAVSFGSTTQIPYMNIAGDDFLYSNNLTYNGSYFTTNWFRATTFEISESGSSATPDSGFGLYRADTDGKPYYINDAGEESLLTERNPTGEFRTTDPATVTNGYVMWMSNGTGSGDIGDIMIKINASATTKTITLVDFSAF